MTVRYCHGCDAEVRFVEGACLLGHQPRAVTPDTPLAALRAEVDRAFDDARLEVEAALHVEVPVPAAVGGGAPRTEGTGVHGTGASRTEETGVHGSPTVGAPSVAAEPRIERLDTPAPRHLGPPLAPPPPPPTRRHHYEMTETNSSLPISDPITQFAPPPRIDWGPERFSLFGLGRLLRSRA